MELSIRVRFPIDTPMKNKRLIIIISIIVAILLVPFIAMQFTNEVMWTLGDFIFMGVLLGVIGLAYEFAARMSGNKAYRAGALLALFATLFLIWMNLAVGIIGSEDNPANALYGIVILVGIIGSIFSKFKPLGMSKAMFVTACVQLLVPVAAFLIWKHNVETQEQMFGVIGVFVIITIFSLMYVGAGLLFKKGRE